MKRRPGRPGKAGGRNRFRRKSGTGNRFRSRNSVPSESIASPRFSLEAFLRERLAAERGVLRIIPPADCEVALVYPGSYAVGMSSLGFQMVYRWINDHPAALAERFFCEGGPALSAENQRPLDQFDLVAFSAAYELEYLEIVRFLLDNAVPVRATERDRRGDPLVVIGGVCPLVNRLPVYDLADVLVLGDGEETVGRLMDAWAAGRGDRAAFLERASRIDGVEVTAGGRRRYGLDAVCGPAAPGCAAPAIEPRFAETLDATDGCSAIVTPHAEFADRFLVEIARGCPYRCRFCFLGSCAPCRTRSFEAICEMIERGRDLTNRFGLIAGAVGRHPAIERLCEYALSERLDVAFSSLRIEDARPAMLDLLAATGQQSVTVAPEAGSERLRRHLGKRLSDGRIAEFAAEAVRRGMRDLKMYFMIGLPTEEPDDVEAIARLVESARKAMRAARPSGRGRVGITANASVFVPKPGTSFAAVETPSSGEIQKRLKRLGGLLGRIDGVTFRRPSLAESEAQRAIAHGGRGMLDVLMEAAGARGGWRRVLRRAAREGQGRAE